MLANFFNDIVLDRVANFIRSNRLEHEHLLERVQLVIPLTWEGLLMSIRRVEYLLELLIEFDKVSLNA